MQDYITPKCSFSFNDIFCTGSKLSTYTRVSGFSRERLNREVQRFNSLVCCHLARGSVTTYVGILHSEDWFDTVFHTNRSCTLVFVVSFVRSTFLHQPCFV